MDNGSVGRFGHYLRVATLSSEIFLHQAEVDIEGVVYTGAEGFETVRFIGKGATLGVAEH
jgi:hypothetical protein